MRRVVRMRLLDAIRDARLFAHPFGDESWRAWRTFLSALFAETPHTSEDMRLMAKAGASDGALGAAMLRALEAAA